MSYASALPSDMKSAGTDWRYVPRPRSQAPSQIVEGNPFPWEPEYDWPTLWQFREIFSTKASVDVNLKRICYCVDLFAPTTIPARIAINICLLEKEPALAAAVMHKYNIPATIVAEDCQIASLAACNRPRDHWKYMGRNDIDNPLPRILGWMMPAMIKLHAPLPEIDSRK